MEAVTPAIGLSANGGVCMLPFSWCFLLPQIYVAQAAAFPTAFLTAWRMLVTIAELKPGQWILLVDIGSAVTAAALQIAKYLGARIIVTSKSEAKLAKAKNLGAEHGINRHNCRLTEEKQCRAANLLNRYSTASLRSRGWSRKHHLSWQRSCSGRTTSHRRSVKHFLFFSDPDSDEYSGKPRPAALKNSRDGPIIMLSTRSTRWTLTIKSTKSS